MIVFKPRGIGKTGRDFFHDIKVIIGMKCSDVLDDID
jgi:hypothetical protein